MIHENLLRGALQSSKYLRTYVRTSETTQKTVPDLKDGLSCNFRCEIFSQVRSPSRLQFHVSFFSVQQQRYRKRRSRARGTEVLGAWSGRVVVSDGKAVFE